MNTIYDGTFTIGQTSATNFVAGPGIKIDEPSAGTVRIDTDETVLYSGTRGVSGTLLDNPFNYDRIRFYLDLGHQNETPGRSDPSFEYPMRGTTANNRINLFYAKGNDNAWFSILQLNITPTSFSAVRSKSINMNSYTSTTNTFTASNNSTEDLQAVVKIVGINRIGGNA